MIELPTIREVLNEWSPAEGGTLDSLEQALVEREQDRMDHLAKIAASFGVIAPIFAKVMVDLDLGAPRSDEEKAFITTQFEEFKAALIGQYAEATGLPPESFVVPSTAPVEEEPDENI